MCVGGLLLVWGAAACQRHSPSTARPAEPAATSGNGAIAALEPIVSTERSEYFELTYWSDGLRVKGYLGRPRGSSGRSGTSRPAVIFNRGGNREYGALSGPEIVPFVEAGFVAVASQYRGNGGGEGREEFGGADVQDVLNLVPLLRSLPDVDPARIGMVGFSRGGMMTYLALKQETLRGTHDIKAAVTIGGVTDLFAWAEERPEMVEVYRDLIGQWPEAARYRARSAVFWPEQINAPLLIQHGEADSKVSVEQSRRLADLLVKAGKTPTLRTYPGEDHALRGHDLGAAETLAWLQRHLGRPGEDLSFEAHRQAIRDTCAAWTP